MADAAINAMKELRTGFSRLRQIKASNKRLLIACDNDTLVMFARPSLPDARYLAPLCAGDEAGFSAELQQISLAERLGAYLFQLHIKDQSRWQKRWTLFGHHQELFNILSNAFNNAVREGTEGAEPPEITRQVASFKEFYEKVLSDRPVSLEDLIDEVPDQMQSWLGIGSENFVWDRFQELHRRQAMVNIEAYFQDDPDWKPPWASREFRKARTFWRSLMPGNKITLDHDASALACLELLNRRCLLPKNTLLVLVTGADNIWSAGATRIAGRIGLDPSFSVLLRPWDFLDECHTHFTGETSGDSGKPENSLAAGTLSGALDVVFSVDGDESLPAVPRREDVDEFKRAWNVFLQACVAERVHTLGWQRRKHIRRVQFVLHRLESATENGMGLASALAARGQMVIAQAADLGLLRMGTNAFARAAPLLYLQGDEAAQQHQLLDPDTYVRDLGKLSHTNGVPYDSNWYARHLLTARAYIWSGHWDVCQQLCRYAIDVSQRLIQSDPERVAASHTELPPIDGREAWYLLSFAERHRLGGTEKGLREAAAALEKYAEALDKDKSNTKTSLEVCQARCQAEWMAMDVVRLFREAYGTVQRDVDTKARKSVELLHRYAAEIMQLQSGLPAHSNTEQLLYHQVRYKCLMNALQIQFMLLKGENLQHTREMMSSCRQAMLVLMPNFKESMFADALASCVDHFLQPTNPNRLRARSNLQQLQKVNAVCEYDDHKREALRALIGMSDEEVRSA